MAKGHIIGSRPERDPVDEITEHGFSVTSTNEIQWQDRSIHGSWTVYLAVALTVVSVILVAPLVAIGFTVLTTIILTLPRYLLRLEENILTDSNWTEVENLDLSINPEDDSVQVRGTGGDRHILQFNLTDVPPRLAGSLGKLVRAADTAIGFAMVVSMHPSGYNDINNRENLSDKIEKYLDSKDGAETEAYFLTRGGLWKANVSFLGIFQDPTQVRPFESSIRGSIPGPKIDSVSPDKLARRIADQTIFNDGPKFFAVGRELKNWLVQLSSELSSEVGSNVPGQFISPIRSRADDYRLGVAINPDTLMVGPEVGLSQRDIESGLLVTGGTSNERKEVLTVLVTHLLENNKRVMIVSADAGYKDLVTLHDSGVSLTLGRDLVLNPVDPDDVPRSEYVSSVMESLEVLTEANLRNAADFELALSRTVALSNTTVADISIAPSDHLDSDEKSTEFSSSGNSVKAMDAIRILHQGIGSRAFYGHQTVSMKRLTELPLSIINLTTGSIPLDMFAWDIFLTKLAWTPQDTDLIVILIEPFNMLVKTTKYQRRIPWTTRIAHRLTNRGPTVLSIRNPTPVPPSVYELFLSCVSLRLRSKMDIAILSDILGLTVVSTGMHSKSRISPRESSFLRVMEPGLALLVHNDSEVCQPIKLDSMVLPPIVEPAELERRASELSEVIDQDAPSSSDSVLLLDTVAGSDRDIALKVLRVLKRYEPLTEEAIRRFVSASGTKDADIEGILVRLEHASMILRGHESHSGVSYTNYRVTMKGDMTLKQYDGLEGAT